MFLSIFVPKKPTPPTVAQPNIKLLTLKRQIYKEDCVLGKLCSFDGSFTLCTLEDPDLNNQKFISCIPVGLYICVPYFSPKQQEWVWLLKNVPNREYVEIHRGNIAGEIEGCILVGVKHGTLGGVPAVIQSREAMNALRNYIGKDEAGKYNSFMLNIIKVTL